MLGTSLIPNNGNHTQNIPPITSVKDNKVSSAAAMCFDPIEYKIKPKQTNEPWSENNISFLVDEKKTLFDCIIIYAETPAQIKPARETVVNCGVSFLHLSEIEKIEKPIAETKPNKSPIVDPKEALPKAIMPKPIVAVKMAIQTFKDIGRCRLYSNN